MKYNKKYVRMNEVINSICRRIFDQSVSLAVVLLFFVAGMDVIVVGSLIALLFFGLRHLRPGLAFMLTR